MRMQQVALFQQRHASSALGTAGAWLLHVLGALGLTISAGSILALPVGIVKNWKTIKEFWQDTVGKRFARRSSVFDIRPVAGHFTGRTTELTTLDAILKKTFPCVVVLHGGPGMGK